MVVSLSWCTPNEANPYALSVADWQPEQNVGHMSSKRPSGQDQQDQSDNMASEYDFSRGVRGKHAMAMRSGYTITIHSSDGKTEIHEVAPRPGTVVLDADVRAYFPDSEAVNRALRGLISLVPHHPPISKPG